MLRSDLRECWNNFRIAGWTPICFQSHIGERFRQAFPSQTHNVSTAGDREAKGREFNKSSASTIMAGLVRMKTLFSAGPNRIQLPELATTLPFLIRARFPMGFVLR